MNDHPYLRKFLPPDYKNINLDSSEFRKAMYLIMDNDAEVVNIIGPGGCGKSILYRFAVWYFQNHIETKVYPMATTGTAANNLKTWYCDPGTVNKTLNIPVIQNGDIFQHTINGVLSTRNKLKETRQLQKWTSLSRELAQSDHITRMFDKGYDKNYVIQDNKMIEAINELNKKPVVLVIDEISMLNANTMDYILRAIDEAYIGIERNKKPIEYETLMDETKAFYPLTDEYGNRFHRKIKLIVFGDPLQLLPVVKDEYKANFAATQPRYPLYFNSLFWNSRKVHSVSLSSVYRQSNNEYKEILARMRVNETTEKDLEYLNKHIVSEPPEDIMILVPDNRTREEINKQKLKKFEEADIFYTIVTQHELTNNKLVERREKFYHGEKVILLANRYDKKGNFVYQNGSRGTFMGYYDSGNLVVRLDENYKYVLVPIVNRAEISYTKKDDRIKEVAFDGEHLYENQKQEAGSFPIDHAYALTYHKAQGLTLDAVYLQLPSERQIASYVKSGNNNPLIYLGLSRVKNPDNLYLSGPITKNLISVHEDAVKNVKSNGVVTPNVVKSLVNPKDVYDEN